MVVPERGQPTIKLRRMALSPGTRAADVTANDGYQRVILREVDENYRFTQGCCLALVAFRAASCGAGPEAVMLGRSPALESAMHALTFDHFGSADVLRWTECPNPVPGPGQALVRMKSVGLNFADVYRRNGSYH